MQGRRVAVTVDGDRREGTVVEATYTLRGGEPVVAVALDGDDRRHLAPLSATEPI